MKFQYWRAGQTFMRAKTDFEKNVRSKIVHIADFLKNANRKIKFLFWRALIKLLNKNLILARTNTFCAPKMGFKKIYPNNNQTIAK